MNLLRDENIGMIYIDCSDNKYVEKQNMLCYLNHNSSGWSINFINLNELVQLADPTDVFWNTEALFEVFMDINISKRIAQAIKIIYENRNKKLI